MNEETPYPITAQPQFTYEPGGQEWMWVCVLAIMAVIIVIFLSRKRKGSRTRAYQVLLKELDGLGRTDSSLMGMRSSSIIKRALQLYFPKRDFVALSASEIEKFLQTEHNKEVLPDIRELAKVLAELENIRFSGNPAPGTEIIQSITRLIRNIMVHLQNEDKRGKRPRSN